MFRDREHAGEELARVLSQYANSPDTVLIALPRGGVAVAHAIAKRLHLPLDVITPRKLRVPGHPELAFGAITETGERIFSERILQACAISHAYLEEESHRQQMEAGRRGQLYRRALPPHHIQGKTVLLIDDGIATGLTIQAALRMLRQEGAAHVVLAAPVAPPAVVPLLSPLVDRLVLLETPENFYAVGQFYGDFDPIEDEEVISLLKDAIETKV